MPLYDVTGKEKLVQPGNAENYEIILKARKEAGGARFSKDIRIIDTALEELISSGVANNKFIFTKAGFLVGHKSALPHMDVNHVWETAEISFPTWLQSGRSFDLAAEMQLKFVGGLVRWRISLRPETWLAYRRPSGTYNKYTGKEITISEYWVNNDYKFIVPPKKKGFSVNELKDKFSGVYV